MPSPDNHHPGVRSVNAQLFLDRLYQAQQPPSGTTDDLAEVRALRGAARALFKGVVAQDLQQVCKALRDGADPNATWSTQSWTVQDQPVPITPLGLAVWLAYEHGDHLPHYLLRDDEGTIVTALLNAGATPDPGMLRRFVHRDDHPASGALEAAVLDRLAAGDPAPGTLWTLNDRQAWSRAHPNEVEPSVLPMTVMHEPQHWLHRAIEHARPDAMNQWFALGGVVGTGGSAGVGEMLWDQRLNSGATNAPPTWVAMLEGVRTPLVRDPSPAVYRKEVMKTLKAYAESAERFLPTDSRMEDCLNWVQDLLRERPLKTFQMLPFEADALDVTREQATLIEAVLRRLEQEHLRTTLNDGEEPAPARPPRRL